MRKWIALSLLAISFAYIESAVVVYLRAIYYPQGFTFPLALILQSHIIIELGRELATMILLLAAAWICDSRGWMRFAYFCFMFGAWDIFYYVWLKVFLNWPVSVFDWDVLFLFPLPWLGPVLSPVLVAISLVVSAIMIIRKIEKGKRFKPAFVDYLMALSGCGLILLTYMIDFEAMLHFKIPRPYHWEIFIIGLLLGWIAFLNTYFQLNLKGEAIK